MMKHLVVTTIAVLVFSFVSVCSTAKADIFFVAKTANASDDNVGSRALPLETIAEAVNRAGAGDYVFVLPGNYQNEDTGWGVGVIPILNSGTVAKPLRIVGLDFPVVSSLRVRNCEHVQISGFKALGSTYHEDPAWKPMPEIVRDVPAENLEGIDFLRPWQERATTIQAAFATYFSVIQELEYSVAIDLLDSSNILVINNSIDGFWAGIQCRNCDSININRNGITHCVNGIFTWEQAPSLSNSLIAFNSISQSLSNGMFVRRGATNVRVYGNMISYSGVSHIALNEGVTDCHVLFNNVSYGGYYTESMEYPGSSGISVNQGGTGNRISFNNIGHQVDLTEVDGNGAILDLMDGGARVAFTWNNCQHNSGSGLNLTASPSALIAGNIFCLNGHESEEPRNGAGIRFSRDQDINNYVVANTFYHNRAAGILSYRTLEKQDFVNLNHYVNKPGVPLAWDGYQNDDSSYKSLEELRSATGWESHGDSDK